MREASGTSGKPSVAAVNSSDPKRVQITFDYPNWLYVILILFGIIAFLLAGFYGYGDAEAIQPGRFYEPPLLHAALHFAWSLFAWFCALILLFLIAVFRGFKHHGKLVASLTATLATIALACVIYFDPQLINQSLDALVRRLNATSVQALVYTLVDMGLILLYWLFAISGWIGHVRRARRAKATADATSRDQAQLREEDKTTWSEMIAGDFVTAAILCFILALLFNMTAMLLLSGLVSVVAPNAALDLGASTCALSWPFGGCSAGAPHNPPTLVDIDIVQAFIYLTLGLLLLGIVALLSILPNARGRQEFARWQDEALFIVTGVLRVLRGPVWRFIRVILKNLLVVMRNVAWPGLIVAAMVCAAIAARYIQEYLHLQSDFRTCASSLCSVYTQIGQAKAGQQQLVALAVSVVACGLGTLFIVSSAAILLGSSNGTRELLRFLARIGIGVLLLFWTFSLPLSAINALLGIANVSGRVPFPWFGLSTSISLGVFLFIGIPLVVLWVRNRRQGRQGDLSASPR